MVLQTALATRLSLTAVHHAPLHAGSDNQCALKYASDVASAQTARRTGTRANATAWMAVQSQTTTSQLQRRTKRQVSHLYPIAFFLNVSGDGEMFSLAVDPVLSVLNWATKARVYLCLVHVHYSSVFETCNVLIPFVCRGV